MDDNKASNLTWELNTVTTLKGTKLNTALLLH